MSPEVLDAELALIDPRWALGLGESDGELGFPIRRMVAGLIRSGESHRQRVISEIHAGDREQARRELHGLRGSFGSLGAMRFVAHCRQLEDQLKLPPSDADQLAIERWQLTMRATLEALSAWSQQYPPTQASAAAPTPTQRRRWWRQLNEDDALVLDELRDSEAWLLTEDPGLDADQLLLALEHADYAELRALLRSLLAPPTPPTLG